MLSSTAVHGHHDLPNSQWSLASMLIRLMSTVIKPASTRHVLDCMSEIQEANTAAASASRQQAGDVQADLST